MSHMFEGTPGAGMSFSSILNLLHGYEKQRIFIIDPAGDFSPASADHPSVPITKGRNGFSFGKIGIGRCSHSVENCTKEAESPYEKAYEK